MSKTISLFWWRWLMAVTVGVVLFSASLIFLPGPMQSIFNRVFFGLAIPDALQDARVAHYIRFTYGVLGAVMIGWMTVFFFILTGPFRRGEREAWNMLVGSLVVWYVVDTTLSIALGFPENAALNTVIAVLFGIPLVATYRDFL